MTCRRQWYDRIKTHCESSPEHVSEKWLQNAIDYERDATL